MLVNGNLIRMHAQALTSAVTITSGWFLHFHPTSLNVSSYPGPSSVVSRSQTLPPGESLATRDYFFSGVAKPRHTRARATPLRLQPKALSEGKLGRGQETRGSHSAKKGRGLYGYKYHKLLQIPTWYSTLNKALHTNLVRCSRW